MKNSIFCRSGLLLALLCSASLTTTATSVHATPPASRFTTEYEAVAVRPEAYTIVIEPRVAPFEFATGVVYKATFPLAHAKGCKHVSTSKAMGKYAAKHRTYSVHAAGDVPTSVGFLAPGVRLPKPKPAYAGAIRKGWRGYVQAVAYRPVMSDKLYSQLIGRTARQRELVRWATGQFC